MKTDFAYIAGLIDGEGYIGLTRSRGSYRPRVIISNCNLDLLKNAQKIIGGYITKKPIPPDRWYQGYNLTIINLDDWLTKTIPYLVGKKNKAILMLEAKKLLKARKKKTNQAGELNMKELAEIDVKLRMKEWLI